MILLARVGDAEIRRWTKRGTFWTVGADSGRNREPNPTTGRGTAQRCRQGSRGAGRQARSGRWGLTVSDTVRNDPNGSSANNIGSVWVLDCVDFSEQLGADPQTQPRGAATPIRRPRAGAGSGWRRRHHPDPGQARAKSVAAAGMPQRPSSRPATLGIHGPRARPARRSPRHPLPSCGRVAPAPHPAAPPAGGGQRQAVTVAGIPSSWRTSRGASAHSRSRSK